MLEAFGITLFALVLMQLTPGPNLVAVASAAFSSGRRAAIMVVLGIASGAMVWVIAVAFGLGATLKALPALVVAMKVGGGFYLLLVGCMSLRLAKGSGCTSTILEGNTKTLASDAHFKRGLFIVITNPKVALGWVAAASYLFGVGLTSFQVAAFAPVAALAATTVYGSYALLFSTNSAVSTYRRFWRTVEGIFGSVFVAIGLALLIDGVRQLKIEY